MSISREEANQMEMDEARGDYYAETGEPVDQRQERDLRQKDETNYDCSWLDS